MFHSSSSSFSFREISSVCLRLGSCFAVSITFSSCSYISQLFGEHWKYEQVNHTFKCRSNRIRVFTSRLGTNLYEQFPLLLSKTSIHVRVNPRLRSGTREVLHALRDTALLQIPSRAFGIRLATTFTTGMNRILLRWEQSSLLSASVQGHLFLMLTIFQAPVSFEYNEQRSHVTFISRSFST